MTARSDETTAGEVARRRLLDGTAAEEHTIESAGMSTSYLAVGDGPPLVLLHGPGEFKERWGSSPRRTVGTSSTDDRHDGHIPNHVDSTAGHRL